VLSPGRLRGVRNWLQARVLPNKPMKLTTAGFSRAGGRARHETRQDPARPQLSGHPLGGVRFLSTLDFSIRRHSESKPPPGPTARRELGLPVQRPERHPSGLG